MIYSITKIEPKIIFDSRKEKTLKINLTLNQKIKVNCSAPQGKSRGKNETHFKPALESIKIIKQKIIPKLKQKKFSSQNDFDNFLIKLDNSKNKKNLGGNTILCLSLAFFKALAKSQNLENWQYISKFYQTNYKCPKFLVNIFGGGLHAQNNLIFQEYLIIPKYQNPEKSLEIAKKIYQKTKSYLKKTNKEIKLADEGNFDIKLKDDTEPFIILKKIIQKLKLNKKIVFGLDSAASNINLKPKILFKKYNDLVKNFNIFYLEDPFSEKKPKNFAQILKKFKSKKILIVGDDLTTTNINLIKKAIKQKAINGVIIKPTQIGTLTETVEAIKFSQKNNLKIIVSHRSGETMDDFISDLAYAIGADFLKAGAPSQKERLIKYKRIIEIYKKLN